MLKTGLLRCIIIGPSTNDGNLTGVTLVKQPDDQYSTSSVSYAMLISESVYKLVVVIERIIWWTSKYVIRPGRYLIWCLRL